MDLNHLTKFTPFKPICKIHLPTPINLYKHFLFTTNMYYKQYKVTFNETTEALCNSRHSESLPYFTTH